MGLLAVPRTAVGLAQPSRDPGHRPRAGDGDAPARTGPMYSGPPGPPRSERADGRALRRAEPADRVVGRVEAPEDGDRIGAARAGPAGRGSTATAGRARPVVGPSRRPGGSPGARSGPAGTARSGSRRGARRPRPGARRRGRGPSGAAPRRAARRARPLPVSLSAVDGRLRVIVGLALLGRVPVREAAGLERRLAGRRPASASAPRQMNR